MFLIAAAAAALAGQTFAPPLRPVTVVQARATVRIISGVRLKLGSASNVGAPRAHDRIVQANGVPVKASLIEFE